MTPEQQFLAKLRQINGGKVIRMSQDETERRPRRKHMSDSQLRAQLKRLYVAGESWDDLYAKLPCNSKRVTAAFRALVASGQITPRPRGNHKRQLRGEHG